MRSSTSSVLRWPDAAGVRAAQYGTLDLPVPVDLLVYAEAEWSALEREGRGAAGKVRWVARSGAP